VVCYGEGIAVVAGNIRGLVSATHRITDEDPDALVHLRDLQLKLSEAIEGHAERKHRRCDGVRREVGEEGVDTTDRSDPNAVGWLGRIRVLLGGCSCISIVHG
jgi:hypothetical protein